MNDSVEELVDDYGVSEAPPVFEIEEDEEARKEENAERAMVQGAQALMADILSWHDAEIAWADSLDGIDFSDTEVNIKAQGLAKQRYRQFMEEAKQKLVSLSNQHLEP